MSRISTRGRYGVRLMLELALHYGQGPIFLKDIAERQEISEKYLGHLSAPLKAAGLVNALRGAHGGYMLAKEPSEISLREIMQVLEGSLSLAECIDTPGVCDRVQSCVTREVLDDVNEKMLQALESTSLQNMVERVREKQKAQQLTYSI